MINNTILALLQDILTFLKKEKNFFAQKEADRLAIAEKTTLFPQSISAYLARTNEKTLLKNIQEITEFINTKKSERPNLSGDLAKAIAEFCINDLPTHFNIKNFNANKQFIGKFGQNLDTLYASAVEKEVLTMAQEFTSLVFKTPFIVIQSPVVLEPEFKKSIQTELKKQHPHGIPTFSVNKNLIGGLRIFVDGKTSDHSWISQINKLTSLINI